MVCQYASGGKGACRATWGHGHSQGTKVGPGMHQEGPEGIGWAWKHVGGGGNTSMVLGVALHVRGGGPYMGSRGSVLVGCIGIA